MAKKVMKKLKEEVEKKGFKLSVTEKAKEGKSKMIASCGFLENELSQFCGEEGVNLADAWLRLENKNISLWAKEKARRKKCKVRFSFTKKNKAFRKSYMKVGFKKLLRAGMMPARTWGVHAVGMSPTERLLCASKAIRTISGVLGINEQIRIRFSSSRIFFLNDSNFCCVQCSITHSGCTCACAVTCLHPHNSIPNVVVCVTIHDNI